MKIMRKDVKAEGLTTLYEPDGQSEQGLDIIFVHGLGGHPVATWLYTSVNAEAPSPDQAALTAAIDRAIGPIVTRSKSLTKDKVSAITTRANTLKKRQPANNKTPNTGQDGRFPSRPKPTEPGVQEAADAQKAAPKSGYSATITGPAKNNHGKSTVAVPPSSQSVPVHDKMKRTERIETYWPLDLLPESCPSARIFTYGFETHMVQGKLSIGQLDIFARGRELLEAVDEMRRGGCEKGREMVFVAHSTGGIVVKEMLRLASNLLDADDERLLASIASVIFMACPLRKTDYGSMVIAMKSMAAATTGVPIDDGTLGRMLGADEDVHLTHLGRDAFDAVWREYNFRVKVYRETSIAPPSHPWGELALALRRDASTLSNNPEEDEDIPGDHVSMCRFATGRDEGYEQVSSYMTRLAHYQSLKKRQLPREELQIQQQAFIDPSSSSDAAATRLGLPGPHQTRLSAAWSSLSSSSSSSTNRLFPRRLLQHPRLQTWLHRSAREDKHKLLWLTGQPGSGVVEALSSLRAHLAQCWAPDTRSSAIITITADEGESLLDSVVFGDTTYTTTTKTSSDEFHNNQDNDNDDDKNGNINTDPENDDDNENLASSPISPKSSVASAYETPQDTSPMPNTPVRTLRSLLSQLYAHDPRLRNLVRKRTAATGSLHDDDFVVESLIPLPNLPDPSTKHPYGVVDDHTTTNSTITATSTTTSTTTTTTTATTTTTNTIKSTTSGAQSNPTDSATDLLSDDQIETSPQRRCAPVSNLDDADIWALFWEDYLCLGLPTRQLKQQQQQRRRRLTINFGKQSDDDDDDADADADDSFEVGIPGIRRVFILVDAAGVVDDKHLSGLLWWLRQLARRSEFSVCVASTMTTATMLPAGSSSSSRSAKSPSESTLLIQIPEENADEIRRYLDTHLTPDMEERPAIAAKLLDRAAGTLLWVEMATKIVNEASEEGVSGEIVLSMLDDIAPPGRYANGTTTTTTTTSTLTTENSANDGLLLDNLYAWKLRRLGGVEQAQALAVMQWVMLAPEPLRLNELLVALRLTLLACRRGAGSNNGGLWDASKTLAVEPGISLKELRAADGDPLGIGTAMMDSPAQFWKWLQQLSQGLLRLESEGGGGGGRRSSSTDDGSTISSEPLGLQRVRPMHDSVTRFFLKGKGFQTLLPGPPAADPNKPPPSTERFIDTSYYTLLHVCLVYLNITELDALGREKPPVNPAPGSALPPTETNKWRAHADAQRRMVMASYPLLRYAVDHLVFHLLCPRDYRYFLPQGALLALLAANRCRIWRRWTHLLGFSIADAAPEALLARAGLGPAKKLLAPVYGARYRLERVLRRVWRMAVAQQSVSGSGSGSGGGTTPRTTPRRAHFRSRSDVSEGSMVFMLMGGEDPLKASWLVPTSPGRTKSGEAAPRTLMGIEEMGGGEGVRPGEGRDESVVVAPEG